MDYKSRIMKKGFILLETNEQSVRIKRFLAGFTFAEVMVSTLIFSILAIAILSVFVVGQRFWHSDVGKVELQQEARLAMDGMTREARESNPSDITISDSGSRMDFSVPDATSAIAYYVENSRLIREYPAGTEKVLASDVEAVNFALSADVLNIQLDLQKPVYGADLSLSSKEQVSLRNPTTGDDEAVDDDDDDDDDDDEDEEEDEEEDDDDHGHDDEHGHDDDDDHGRGH